MFETTCEKYLIQLSVELIRLDIVYDSNKFIWITRNIGLNQLYQELNQTFLESWFKRRKISGFGVCFFSVYTILNFGIENKSRE